SWPTSRGRAPPASPAPRRSYRLRSCPCVPGARPRPADERQAGAAGDRAGGCPRAAPAKRARRVGRGAEEPEPARRARANPGLRGVTALELPGLLGLGAALPPSRRRRRGPFCSGSCAHPLGEGSRPLFRVLPLVQQASTLGSILTLDQGFAIFIRAGTARIK